MGGAYSCNKNDFEDLVQLQSFLVKSMSSVDGGDSVKTAAALRSVSFNGRDSVPTTQKKKSPGSAKKIAAFGGSLSFNDFSFRNHHIIVPKITSNNHERKDMLSIRSSNSSNKLETNDNTSYSIKMERNEINNTSNLESGDHKRLFQAAIKLQKVYKSFRTRRQLADCAVLVEQRWWKLLDFAELKRSSISFFHVDQPETAVSRWSRATSRVAKVGKGLSKDERAQKLALQHWLEAIDPRHRYGHNLHFYYANWLQCLSKQPFFYWLDIGEGKEVNLADKCHRSKLQQQCIKYLGPKERKAYEVVIQGGKFYSRQSGEVIDTRSGPKGVKWIFVLSTSKTMYIGMKQKGTFQHSSFLAGGATLSAGRLVVEDGVLKAVWPHSGHYLPTNENFEDFMSFLKEYNVDLSDVQKSPTDEDEEPQGKKPDQQTEHLNNNNNNESSDLHRTNSTSIPSRKSGKPSNITSLEIPKNEEMMMMKQLILVKQEYQDQQHGDHEEENYPSEEDYETAEDEDLSDEEFEVSKPNLFDDQDRELQERPVVPKEKILQRIDSHKGMKSYQLGKCLSCKWSTGAGPRIGCVRDYPSELQTRTLEEVLISPRPTFGSSKKKQLSLPPMCRESTMIMSPRSPVEVFQVILPHIPTP